MYILIYNILHSNNRFFNHVALKIIEKIVSLISQL